MQGELQKIQKQLAAKLPMLACEPIVHQQIPSTSTEAHALLKKGKPTPFLVMALSQSEGRGQKSNRWHSELGGLYISLALQLNRGLKSNAAVAPFCGLQLCETLRAWLNIDLELKHPNDILYQGRKLGGLLIEAEGSHAKSQRLIAGLGLNLNQKPESWPAELKATATSLAAIVPKPPSLAELAAVAAKSLFAALQNFPQAKIQTTDP